MNIIDVETLPIISASQAAEETGLDVSEFAEAGLYRVLFGSRGEIDELEFLGDAEVFEIPTVEELAEELDWDEQDLDTLEEFYGHGLEDLGYEFGYTEEGYDLYMRVS